MNAHGIHYNSRNSAVYTGINKEIAPENIDKLEALNDEIRSRKGPGYNDQIDQHDQPSRNDPGKK